MKSDQFEKLCKNTLMELSLMSPDLLDGLKDSGSSISVQEDFYEPGMFCIVEGDQKISGESDYDDRCIASSIEKDVAKGIKSALQNFSSMSSKLKKIIIEGKDLVESYNQLNDECKILKKEIAKIDNEYEKAKKEILYLKGKLDESILSSIIATEGNGNISVADPKKFSKVIRVLENLRDKIEASQNGDSIGKGFLTGELTKEVLYFKKMIDTILESVKG